MHAEMAAQTTSLQRLSPVSNPIPLIIEVEEPQSINAEAVEKGWHFWHILLLLGHWAWPQGLECSWRKVSTFAINLFKNYRVQGLGFWYQLLVVSSLDLCLKA